MKCLKRNIEKFWWMTINWTTEFKIFFFFQKNYDTTKFVVVCLGRTPIDVWHSGRSSCVRYLLRWLCWCNCSVFLSCRLHIRNCSWCNNCSYTSVGCVQYSIWSMWSCLYGCFFYAHIIKEKQCCYNLFHTLTYLVQILLTIIYSTQKKMLNTNVNIENYFTFIK